MIKHFRKATDTLVELFLYYMAMITVAAVIFSLAEGVALSTSFYWAGITATTTGYGDISPHTATGRILSVVLANVAVFIFGPLIIARMLEHLVDNPDRFDNTEQEELKASVRRLEEAVVKLSNRE